MTGIVTYRIEGLREMEAALRQLKDSTAKNVMRRVLKKAAKPVAEEMARRAAVRIGTLRKSVDVSTKLGKRQKGLHIKADPNDVEVFAGAGVLPHPHMIEFGTEHSAPQPFARPAWDSTRMAALRDIAADLGKEIDKAAKRAAKKAAKHGG